MTSTGQLKEPILGKKSDAAEPQIGRVRRASGLTRVTGYIGNNPYNSQPTIITSITTLATNPGIEELRRLVGARMIEMPRFRSKLVIKPKVHWVEVEFDPGYHFEVFGAERKVSQKELEDLVAKTRERPLRQDKPLWRAIHIPEMEDGTSKVVTMIDHAIGDGISLTNAFLFKLIDEGPKMAEMADKMAIKTGGSKPNPPLSTRIAAYFHGIYAGHTSVFWKQDPPNPLKLTGKPSSTKLVSGSPKISLAQVKEISKHIGHHVTVNDVIMAIATKMIGLYFRDIKKESTNVIKKRKMRTQIIVDTRSRKKKGLATEFEDPNNDFAGTTFQFPLNKFDGGEDLVLEVKRKIDFIKCSPQPIIKSKSADRLLPFMSRRMVISTAINSLNIATAMLSNVPGPQMEVHLAGALVLNIEFYLFSAVGMYIGFFSYNGAISTTVNLDESIGADPHDLAALWPIAFAELYKSVIGRDPEPFSEKTPEKNEQEQALAETPAENGTSDAANGTSQANPGKTEEGLNG